MPVYSSSCSVATRGFCDVQNITPQVEHALGSSTITNGVLTVFVPGSTAAVTTIEYENGVVEDLKHAVERLVPQNIQYAHDARWGDGNGFAHVRAAILGPSITIPVQNGVLLCGVWQQIVLVDFDNRPRHREVIIQIMGE
jgi:secondary thiamine-phosphate synthase enzyme